MLRITCVLKAGGVYTIEYVRKLQSAIARHLTVDYQFVCLTDVREIDFCDVIPLKHNWSGWWSKIELFRPELPSCPTIYFDLDTLILGNIDYIAHVARFTDFAMLRGFNAKRNRILKDQNMASGVMVGDFASRSEIYTRFLKDPQGYINEYRTEWRHGDQGFIASVVGTGIPKLQELLPENYIVGKRLTQQGEFIPKKAKILAWSGEPRLHTIKGDLIANYWK